MLADMHGADLAERVHRSRLAGSDLDDGACGDLSDYRRAVVAWAHAEVGVIEALDRELWRYAELSDPRLRAFKAGYCRRMRELEG